MLCAPDAQFDGARTRTVWHDGGCTSWYQSRSGRVIAMFPGFSFSFRRLARRFRPEHHVITLERTLA